LQLVVLVYCYYWYLSLLYC